MLSTYLPPMQAASANAEQVHHLKSITNNLRPKNSLNLSI